MDELREYAQNQTYIEEPIAERNDRLEEDILKKYKDIYVYINSARQLCYPNGDMSKKISSAACYCWFIKVIDLMAEWIEHKTDITVINKHICKEIKKDKIYECNAKTCIKCIKQYFEDKAKEK